MEAGAHGRDGRSGVTFRKPSPIFQLVGLIVLAFGAAGGLAFFNVRRANAFFEPHALLARFPQEEAAVLSVDIDLLRRTGFLTGSKAPLEADYKQFLEGTGFDYRRDLDYLVASFSDKGNFFIAHGRFNWSKMRAYTAKQGGSCYQQLFRVQGSTPDRHISFLPLRDDAIALAVSTNDLAVSALTTPGPPVTTVLPTAPVWFSIPGAELRKPNTFPANLRLMLSALQTVDRVTLTIGPTTSGLEARLETICRTPGDAGVLTSQLRVTTANLKDAVSHDKDAQHDELASTLSTGSFDQSDRKVVGRWPIRKGLLESLTDGI
jgi:hypothetical protein